jgi:hypothetical protein
MTTFAERGPVPVEGRCLWCGGPLRPTAVRVADPYAPWGGRYANEGPPGIYGTGHFCTLRCGFDFGDRLAEFGRRLRSGTSRAEA